MEDRNVVRMQREIVGYVMQTVGQKEECCTRGTVDGVFEQTPTLTLWNRQTGYYEYSAQR
jgi:hypothetical protein